MDRLSSIAIFVIPALLVACSDSKEQSRSSRERVNAVQARPATVAAPAEMCDVFHAATDAPVFAWPELTSEPPAAPAGHWRWINVWATWCKPCIEEMPRLVDWRERLGARGLGVSLHLISSDESDEKIASFRAAHPRTPPSLRLVDPDAVPEWMAALGVPAASLPVHVLVDPGGRIRCVRASSVEDTDYPAVESLLRGG
jgi:thiol-disulfide isomerase/thioredoxin